VTSTARTYFEKMYAENDDPWQFATSAYERRKYELSMASLPKSHYENAFEPGCSIGVLSAFLAGRCRRLLVADFMIDALESAAERLKSFRHVRVEERAIPAQWPDEVFDLIVLSEVAYYFDESTLLAIMDRVVSSTAAGAHVLGVHWRGETNYPLTGDRAHELIASTEKLRAVVHHEEEQFVLDVWERLP
jgi:hypothetical protein